MTMSMFRRILFLAPLAIAAIQSSFAASPGVTAVLSNSQPAVGQMVQLEIKVNGANSANVPETISIGGLEIHQTGTSRQFEMRNFDVSSSVTYNYTILPLKAGQFKIPPQTVRVGKDSLRTPELVLNVAQGSSSSGSSAQSGQTQVSSKVAFAELVVAKKDAYVGEMVPAEIRLGFDPRARSPFDLFNLDDPFSDPFFSDPFGGVGERTELPIRSESAMLNVKPLPPNAPPNFSGAVGNFTMTADAKPKTVQVGNPITVTSTITGRGNFDRMNGPALEDERGWHKYPPSSKFKQDDDVGMSGEKTFEMVIAPNEKKPAVPPLVFAYFDPVKENYVTLRSTAVPIQVEGGAGQSAATAPAVAATSAAPTSTVGVIPAPTAKTQDML